MTLKDDGIKFPSDFFRFGRSNWRFKIKVLNSFTFTSKCHQYYFHYLFYTTPKLCGLNDDIYFCWPICHLGRAQQAHLSLLHLAAAGVAWSLGAWVICRLLVHLSGGWGWLGLGPDGTTVCACLASSQYGGWPLRRSIPRRGLSRFYDMSQKSYSISFPVVTGLSRLKMKEHRPYLLVDKWQYHIVRTHGMEYIGATIFGK